MREYDEGMFPVGTRVKVVSDTFDGTHGKGPDGVVFSYIGREGIVKSYVGRCHILSFDEWVPYPEYGFTTPELTMLDAVGGEFKKGDRVQLSEKYFRSYGLKRTGKETGTVTGVTNLRGKFEYWVEFDSGEGEGLCFEDDLTSEEVRNAGVGIRVGSRVEIVPGHAHKIGLFAGSGEVVSIDDRGSLWPVKVRFDTEVHGRFWPEEVVLVP